VDALSSTTGLDDKKGGIWGLKNDNFHEWLMGNCIKVYTHPSCKERCIIFTAMKVQ
jgi:hypothetical protein